MYHSESPNVVGIEILISGAKLRDFIHRIIKFFEERRIGIYHMDWSDGDDDLKLIFMVIKYQKNKSETIINEIKEKIEYIIDIKVPPKLWGKMIFPNRLFPIHLGPYRVVLTDSFMLRSIIDEACKSLGQDIAESIAYHLGVFAGKEYIKEYYSNKDLSDMDEVFKYSDRLLTSYGWGRIIEYHYDKNKLIIKFDRLLECEVLKDERDKPASSFFKGVLQGFATTYFKRPVVVIEKKCIAVGDPYCEFEITIL